MGNDFSKLFAGRPPISARPESTSPTAPINVPFSSFRPVEPPPVDGKYLQLKLYLSLTCSNAVPNMPLTFFQIPGAV
ncbi:unnamed protein product [Orchesella dallaii]|uniref:Uncharacterized protein n=1 Tax=Orchesella dallaii TaxID=48710 RepID=A0ABP1RLC2_9HEXA